MDRSVDEAVQVALLFPQHMRPLPQQVLRAASRALRVALRAGILASRKVSEKAGDGFDLLTANVAGVGALGIASSKGFRGKHSDVHMQDLPPELVDADMALLGEMCARYKIGINLMEDPATGNRVILFHGRDAEALDRALKAMIADVERVSGEQREREGIEGGSAEPVIGDSPEDIAWEPDPSGDGAMRATVEFDESARVDLLARPDGSWSAQCVPRFGDSYLEGAPLARDGSSEEGEESLEGAMAACWTFAHDQLAQLKGPALDAEQRRQAQVMREVVDRFEDLHKAQAAEVKQVNEAWFVTPDKGVFNTRKAAEDHCAEAGLDPAAVTGVMGWMTTKGDLLADRTEAIVAQQAIDAGAQAPEQVRYARRGAHGAVHAPMTAAETFAQIDASLKRQGTAAGRGIGQTPEHGAFHDEAARRAGKDLYEGFQRASEAAVAGAAAKRR